MNTRRRLLAGGAAAAAALVLGGGCAAGRGTSAAGSVRSQTAIAGFNGRIIGPGDPAYDRARAGYWRSPADERRPALIARCTDADDVARAIGFARRRSLPLAVRGGGHSFVGWGNCDGGVVIDTGALTTLTVDPGGRVAQAGAGVRSGELVAAAAPAGLAPVMGQCPGVGATGLALGGGLGWLSGLHGAACDNLLSARLVTADGRLLRASAEENPDLLWALRGGGGNFGVVTELTFRLHSLAGVTAGRIDYPLEAAPSVLPAWAALMASAPDELQASLTLSQGAKRAYVSVLLCHCGEPAAAEACARALRTVATPEYDSVKRRAFEDTAVMYPGSRARFSHIRGCCPGVLDESILRAALDAFSDNPGPGAAIGLEHFMHGSVTRVPPGAAAFELRDPGTVQAWIAAEWDDAARGPELLAWVKSARERLAAQGAGRVYPNFPDSPAADDAAAAWPDNHRRLRKLKTRYDPDNLFRYNYNIRPDRTPA